MTIRAPEQAGRYQLVIDLVREGVTWFSERASLQCRCRSRSNEDGSRYAGERWRSTNPLATPDPSLGYTRRQAQLAADDVDPLRDRAGLVERDLAVASLTAEAAVGWTR